MSQGQFSVLWHEVFIGPGRGIIHFSPSGGCYPWPWEDREHSWPHGYRLKPQFALDLLEFLRDNEGRIREAAANWERGVELRGKGVWPDYLTFLNYQPPADPAGSS